MTLATGGRFRKKRKTAYQQKLEKKKGTGIGLSGVKVDDGAGGETLDHQQKKKELQRGKGKYSPGIKSRKELFLNGRTCPVVGKGGEELMGKGGGGTRHLQQRSKL